MYTVYILYILYIIHLLHCFWMLLMQLAQVQENGNETELKKYFGLDSFWRHGKVYSNPRSANPMICSTALFILADTTPTFVCFQENSTFQCVSNWEETVLSYVPILLCRKPVGEVRQVREVPGRQNILVQIPTCPFCDPKACTIQLNTAQHSVKTFWKIWSQSKSQVCALQSTQKQDCCLVAAI